MTAMPTPQIPAEIAGHYDATDEATRLRSGYGPLEEARTRLIIERFIPAPPGAVLDVGGGPGVYAHWLAEAGYKVHLRDVMEKHVGEASAISAASTHPLASVEVGDARGLDEADGSVDSVLMLGPLYHLTELADRARALEEAWRVLRPGGVLIAAGISRFASLLDGLWRNLIVDPVFRGIVERDLNDGQHRNPTNHPAYFTRAFFHLPGELRSEVEQAGFLAVQVLAVEGVGWIMPDFEERWAVEANRGRILELIARTETEPAILGASQHLLAVGKKPR